MKVGAISIVGGANDVMDDNFFKARDIAEGHGTSHERESWTASRATQGAVLVVRRGVVPAAKTLTGGTGKGAGWMVCIEEGEKIRG